MDLRRLRIGEWATGVAGVVLLVALFLPWYGLSSFDVHGDAFSIYSGYDIVLLVVAVLAAATVPVTMSSRTPSSPLAYQSLAWLPCAVVAVVAIVKFLDGPGTLEHEVGSYIGTLAALALPVTLLVAMRDERLSTGGRLTDSTGAPIESAPEIELLPAPRP